MHSGLSELLTDVFHIFRSEVGLRRVDQGDLFAEDQIGIVAYAERQRPHSLEYHFPEVIDSDIDYLFRDLAHIEFL